MRKKLLVLGLIVAFVFSMTACGGGDEGGEAAKTNLTIIDGEWYGLDAYQLDGTAGAQGLNSTGLFQWDPETNTMVDNVCTDWELSEDGKTATFNVPEGMYYSTGEQVEPEDVVASLQHGLDVSPYKDGYSNIKSMETDGRKVILHMSEFRADMQYYLCAGFAVVIDKDELDKMSDEELLWGCHPYGQYALAEEDGYVSGSEVNLVKNEGFKCANPLVENQGPGNFETIKIRFNVEEFTQTEDLLAGNVDIITALSSDQYLELKDNEDVTIENTTYPNIMYFEMNTNKGIFQDEAVRKALALSLDRDGLVEATDGLVEPCYSMITDTMQNFSQEAKDYFQENLANDPEQAKKLLEDAGWKVGKDGYREKDGQTLEFTWYAWTDQTTLPEAMAEQFKQVGFKMNIENIDWNYVYENISAGKYDAGIETLAWAEPMLIFNACYYDKKAPGNTDEYYAQVEKAAKELDTDKRTKMVGDLQIGMFKNVNIIPMYAELGFTALNKDLKGFKVMADGSAAMNDLSF